MSHDQPAAPPRPLLSRAWRAFPYHPRLLTWAERWLVAWGSYGARIFPADAPADPAWEAEGAFNAAACDSAYLLLAAQSPPALLLFHQDGLREIARVPLHAHLQALVYAGLGAFAGIDARGHLVRVQLTLEETLQLDDLDLADFRDVASPNPPGFERLALAAAEDGDLVAFALSRRKATSVPVVLFSLQAMKVRQVLKGARAAVVHLAFTPGAATLLAATWSVALAWSLPRGKARTLLRARSYPELIGALDPHHVLLADHKERLVCVDLRADAEVWDHPNYGPAALRGERVVHARFGQLTLRDARTGAALGTSEAPRFPGLLLLQAQHAILHTSAGCVLHRWELTAPHLDPLPEGGGALISAVASSPDGRWLVLGLQTGALLTFDRRAPDAPPRLTPPPPGAFGHSACDAITLEPEHDRLWVGIGEHLACFTLSTGDLLALSDALKDDIAAILPCPDRGLVLATARARRRSYGAFIALDLHTLASHHEARLDRTARQLQRLDADHARLFFEDSYACWRDVHLTRWTDTCGDVVYPFAAGVLISPDTRYACSLHRHRPPGAREDVWSLMRWTTQPNPTPIEPRAPCPTPRGGLAFSADGLYVFTLHDDKTLRRWDADTGEPLAIYRLAIFSPQRFDLLQDGTGAVIAGLDGSAELLTFTNP